MKVLDFGLAKALSNVEAADREEESLTMEGVVLGTSSYMSLEQVRGEDLDRRSDLFSLGVVLYELATRKRPFVRKNGITILDATCPSEISHSTESEFARGTRHNHFQGTRKESRPALPARLISIRTKFPEADSNCPPAT